MSDESGTTPPADRPTVETVSSKPDAAIEDPDIEVTEVPLSEGHRSRAQIQTTRLDSRDFRPSWPMAIATLEQLSGWAVLALRLGTLALIQQCVRELAQEDARAEVIVRLRALTEALAHMPLET